MSSITVGTEKNILKSNQLTFEERQKQLDQEKEKEEEQQQRARKSPFKNFVQVNKDLYKAEDWLMSKSPIAYRIFKFLVNNMDDFNAVMCSYKVLQETFDISSDTVRRAIKLLKDKGYIHVFKSGTSNVYAVNDKLVWNSWGTNYERSKFPANIILSISEQEKGIQAQLQTLKHKEIVVK